MKPPIYLKVASSAVSWLGVLALTAGSAHAASPQPEVVGPEDQNKQISVTVWLNLHNKSTLDDMVKDIYDDSSPNYHHFLTKEQYQSQFAPSAADAAQVRSFLTSHNLKVTSTDKANHFVVAQGRVADAQAAFNVKINRAKVNGAMHRVASSEAAVVGSASTVVAAVTGLSDLKYQAYASPAVDWGTGQPYPGVPVKAAGANGLTFSANCLRPTETHVFTTGASNTPTATYTGNRYGADVGTPAPNQPPCGYDAAEMQNAYGLTSLIKNGLDGTNQTIVIVDAFGSNTILADANQFSSQNGLPLLNAENFQVFTPNGSATCTATNGCITGNWQFETTLDVEWAHAMAPGANIVLVLAADNSFTNLDLANLFAIQNGLGNQLSNSFGIPEIVLAQLAPSELVVQNGIAEIAAALGISQNVSTGDSGDNLLSNQKSFNINSVSAGANSTSPFATAVGGTSTFLDANNNIKLQTGWGLNETRIAEATPNPPTIPPLSIGFLEGAGGGASMVYALPKFQKGLPGKFRQTPDIAMNADPLTGNEIIVTPTSVPGDPQQVNVFGGTSLSAPMFTAVWALANQANAINGGTSLGQAAPLLYKFKGNAIIDVNLTKANAKNNVTGVLVIPPAAPQQLSADALAAPLNGTKQYVSALFNSATSTRWNVVTFGTDSSLSTGPGWDNVTGLGTPNGDAFIKAAIKAASKK